MPAQNRVTPLGQIVAIPLRGAWTGNRGILHEGRRIVRSHASDLDNSDVGVPGAKQINATLHAERIVPGAHRRRLHELSWPSLPGGTFVVEAGGPALVLGGAIVPWTHQGYGRGRPRPKTGTATVITPPSTVAVLRAGYPVQIDETARRPG